jgi:hypothetical protein
LLALRTVQVVENNTWAIILLLNLLLDAIDMEDMAALKMHTWLLT